MRKGKDRTSSQEGPDTPGVTVIFIYIVIGFTDSICYGCVPDTSLHSIIILSSNPIERNLEDNMNPILVLQRMSRQQK